MRFNTLQVAQNTETIELSQYDLNVLKPNIKLDLIQDKYLEMFGKEFVKNISFSRDGFFTLILSLEGKIAVSVGESEAIVEGAKKAKEYGADITFIALNKDGTLDTKSLDDSFDYVFVSSYIVDTYVKVDLEEVKEKTAAKLISNGTVEFSTISDIYVFDSYKLCSMGAMGVLVYEDEFEESAISQLNLLCLDLTIKAIENKNKELDLKDKFLDLFTKQFGDDLYFFVDPKDTLEYTLYLGLKGIKMRELIRTMAFEDIYITNGEGCSLGLSKPSRIIQEMGYSEDESRWGLSLDFSEKLEEKTIGKIVNMIFRKYTQIKVLG